MDNIDLRKQLDDIEEKLSELRVRWRQETSPSYRKLIEQTAALLKEKKEKIENKIKV